MSAALNPHLRAYIEATRDYFAAPSVTLTVVKGTETVLETFGTTRIDGDTPITGQTLFPTGACSRAYTSAATALLVDQGLLRWDDRVCEHLPELILSDPWITENLTIRDLLGQRIAWTARDPGEAGWSPETSVLTALDGIKDTVQITGFRERYAPHPLAYMAMAEIVARVVEQPLAEFLEHRLFRPLGLEHTFSARIWPDRLDLAQPHKSGPNGATPLEPPLYQGREGDGDIFTSASDSAVWLRFHLRRGFLERTPIIKWSTMAEILAPQIVAEPDPRRGELFADYCLGWRAANYGAARILYHEGHEPGSSALNLLLPSENLGIAVRLGLHCPPAARAITYRLLDAFLDRPAVDWAPKFKTWAEEDLAAVDTQAR